ncbi:amidohydrolase family protein [Mariniflexile gromovii]|uniref:Amidohydrolase family protein n=1 Tax=Mariniflexile gromovii TaxID=362523 RepID=A0ABS4BZ34_9FLAO|nr:amidohydrolase family protein [Mariniflexile gromovii]MBP0905829.1 amidohydrolase family protein [Mariniflexile gromovii]
MKTLITYISILCCSLIAKAQQTPAPKQTQDIAIMGATAHIGNGNIIENSLIILKDGKITTVADASVIKIDLTGMETIEANGKHVYPGFIIPNTTLGLVEVDAVRASKDEAELGTWNPHIRSLIAYNAESKVVESMRPNGVLLGQVTPRSGRISGTSSIVQFDAWNWEDAAVKIDDAIHLNWPSSFTRGPRSFGGSRTLKPNEKYAEQVTEVTTYFKNALAHNNVDKTKTHLPFEALQGVFDGSKKLHIHIDDEKGIIDAVNFAKENQIKNLVIVGGEDAYKVVDILKENNVSVVLQRIHSLPDGEDKDYDLPYKSAKLLTDKGILVALECSGSHERAETRNLPFLAGTTVAHGLTKEQALQLITLNPAKILGIEGRYGSLETGKSATLFISEGDALDMRTNIISHAFIDGRLISLETHQTELWKRYSGKHSNK